MSLGLLLVISVYSYEPNDYTRQNLSSWEYSNLGGPTGATLAHFIMGSFGLVGLVWPLFVTVWGALLVFGFPGKLNISKFLTFSVILCWLAGLAEIQGPYLDLAGGEPFFGYGGNVGKFIAVPLVKYLGFGGAHLGLICLTFITLAITGNIALRKTKESMEDNYDKGQIIKNWTVEKIKAFKEAEERRLRAYEQELYAEEEGSKKTKKKSSSKTTVKPTKLPEVSGGLMSALKEAAKEPLLNIYYKGKSHKLPSADLFSESQMIEALTEEEMGLLKNKLETELGQFKVEGEVKGIYKGPTVTTFEFAPSPGQKVSKITSLSDDLARLLQAKALRILNPIPGKAFLGFEIPNPKTYMIGFRNLLQNPEFKNPKLRLPVAMGMDTNGNPVISDLAAMPHLLVAGSTGSGKSVFMNTLIASLLCKYQAKDLRFVMIDPKMVELAPYNKIPHMAMPVITDPQNEAKEALDALVDEMEERYSNMKTLGVRNIVGYNQIIKSSKKADYPEFKGRWATIPYTVVIIDELADMMMILGKDAERPITRLAQKARACGIHMVIATQRPSADVVTGLIKANFPTRISFRVSNAIDSRVIIDQTGAEKLLGRGDALYQSATGTARIHGAFIDDDEIHALVQSVKPKEESYGKNIS